MKKRIEIFFFISLFCFQVSANNNNWRPQVISASVIYDPQRSSLTNYYMQLLDDLIKDLLVLRMKNGKPYEVSVSYEYQIASPARSIMLEKQEGQSLFDYLPTTNSKLYRLCQQKDAKNPLYKNSKVPCISVLNEFSKELALFEAIMQFSQDLIYQESPISDEEYPRRLESLGGWAGLELRYWNQYGGRFIVPTLEIFVQIFFDIPESEYIQRDFKFGDLKTLFPYSKAKVPDLLRSIPEDALISEDGIFNILHHPMPSSERAEVALSYDRFEGIFN